MKLSHVAVGFLATLGSLSSVQAQYFSEGWKPGQKVSTDSVAEADATYDPSKPAATSVASGEEAAQTTVAQTTTTTDWKALLNFDNLLGTVLQKAGFNISMDRVNGKIWDERIPLITDENYKDLIVNEQFQSEEEAKDRAWAIIVTISSNRQEPLSKLVDEMFDSAFNQSLVEADIPNVRWGRIDYFNVTYVTTKWNIWKAPYIIVAQDRGQSLWFYRPGNIRLRDYAFREFLKTEGWKATPPWSGLYAPGGEREWMLDLFAVWLTKIYNITVLVPRWLLLLATGGIGSLLLNFLHKPAKPSVIAKASASTTDNDKKPVEASVSESPAVSQPAQAEGSSEPVSPAPPAKRTSARQRKGKKGTA